MTEYFIPDGGFDRQRKPGRPKKQRFFNPNRAYLKKAVAAFIKKGGKIRKMENPYELFYQTGNAYRLESVLDLSILD